MAAKYRYSGDAAWLNENKASILAAWDWVQGERAHATLDRERREGGLLRFAAAGPGPRREGWHHFFFSDVFTWKGMMEMAEPFGRRPAGSRRLWEEASEYRDCLLEAIGRAQYVDPATGLFRAQPGGDPRGTGRALVGGRPQLHVRHGTARRPHRRGSTRCSDISSRRGAR